MELMVFDWIVYGGLALLMVLFLAAAVRVVREYERGVMFTLGRFTGCAAPDSSSSSRSFSRWSARICVTLSRTCRPRT